MVSNKIYIYVYILGEMIMNTWKHARSFQGQKANFYFTKNAHE